MFRFCHCLGANCMSGFHKYLKTLIIVTIVVMIHTTHTPLHDYCCTPILFCSNNLVCCISFIERQNYTANVLKMSYCSIRHCLPSYVHVHSCLKNTHTHDTNISEHSRAKKYFHSYFHYGIQFFVIYEFIPSRFLQF